MDTVAVVVRVATPEHPSFQLRKGESGISVFDPSAGESPLTEDEILEAFRPGSIVVYRTLQEIADAGLSLVESVGADSLPERLRDAHREITAPATMTRAEFKAALKRVEET